MANTTSERIAAYDTEVPALEMKPMDFRFEDCQRGWEETKGRKK